MSPVLLLKVLHVKKELLHNSVLFGKKTKVWPSKKEYFRISFCLDLMRKRDIIEFNFVCVGVEFLDFNVLLPIKFEQKVIGN